MVSAANPADSVPGFAGTDADGAPPDTVSAGAMHLAGGTHTDRSAPSGMLFVGGGAGGLDVQFVDLTAASDRHAGGAGDSTVAGAAAPDRWFATALDKAHAALPAAFSTGPSSGVPGGAMQPEAMARTGSAALHHAPMPPAVVPLKLGA